MKLDTFAPSLLIQAGLVEIGASARASDLEIRRVAERARVAERIEEPVECVTITSEPMGPQAVLDLVVERVKA
jgi:hypothetical protein